MAISGVSTSGLISGINASDLISKMLEIERRPAKLLELRQNDYELKISAILSLSSKLSSYKASLNNLNYQSTFNTKSASVTTSSSGEDLLTVSASNTAAPGNYSVKVNQLAASSKKASGGFVDENLTAVASAAGNFSFKVGLSGAVTTIGVDDSMTLEGLRDAINTAGAGVTASIINDGTGSNPYRLILTADDSGSSNTLYITENDTSLDFENKQIESGYAFADNSYSGTFASAGTYSGTSNKTFLVEAVSAGESGTAAYKYSIDGGITWLGYNGSAYDSNAADDTDGGAITTSVAAQDIDGSGTNNEGVQASFTAGSTLAVGDRFSIDVFNPEMQEAKDAVIQIDNATIVKSTNTITDAIPGITMDLLKADTSSTLTLSVTTSSSSAKGNIEKFVESYNDLFKFINEQLSYDPDTGKANPLLGDPTLLEIRRKIGDTISGVIPGLSNASYTNLSQIGITSDYKTGQLSIDNSILSSALSSNPDDVAKLFIGIGEPTNYAVSYEKKTSATRAGNYGISISSAPEQATLTGDNDLSSTGLSADETLIFKYSDDYTETDSSTTAFSVTLSAGSTIGSIVTTLNSTFSTKDVALTASKTSDGKLKITSDEYGEDIWFMVTTDQGAGSGQIWSASGSYEDGGVDIAGSINNHVATGKGNILTAVSGFPEEGLSVSTTSNQTGGFGTIRVSRGIADILPSILDSYVNSDTGVLKSKESSLQNSIDDIADRIDRMEQRISEKEESLQAEFARLEVLLSKYDTMAQYLTNNLTTLPKIGG
jgi:flagellar hook-associated protein 2